MCKYCGEEWDMNEPFYLEPDSQKLCYLDENECVTKTKISFCPWCGRSLNIKSKDIYCVSHYEDISINNMEILEDETEAKDTAVCGLRAGESNYLYTYRLIKKQRVFLPDGCIFEDIE